MKALTIVVLFTASVLLAWGGIGAVSAVPEAESFSGSDLVGGSYALIVGSGPTGLWHMFSSVIQGSGWGWL